MCFFLTLFLSLWCFRFGLPHFPGKICILSTTDFFFIFLFIIKRRDGVMRYSVLEIKNVLRGLMLMLLPPFKKHKDLL